MAKGMRVKLNYEVSRDPDTGVEVTRLTPLKLPVIVTTSIKSVFSTTVVICCLLVNSMATGTTICWI